MGVGVDIGGSTIKVAQVDPDGAIDGAVLSVATPSSIDEVPDLVCDMVAGLDHRAGIGVGCAGVVDRHTGVWKWMPHAVGSDVPLRSLIEDRLGAPVAIDNDANMAVRAEARAGAGVGHRLVLMVLVGTGIGAGVAISGDVESGSGALGEVGHMRLADGPACACGASGCWEALVSGRVMDAAARSILGPASSARDLAAAADSGDRACVESLGEMGRWFGIGLGNLVLTLAPDIVVLGGGAMQSGERIVAGAIEYLEKGAGALAAVGIPPVRTAAFDTLAGLVGAGLAVEEMKR